MEDSVPEISFETWEHFRGLVCVMAHNPSSSGLPNILHRKRREITSDKP